MPSQIRGFTLSLVALTCLTALVVLLTYVLSSPTNENGNSSQASDEASAQLRKDLKRGRALLKEYECSRCHASDLWEPPAPEKNCTGCHQRIRRDELDAPEADRARWKRDVRHLLEVPRLQGSGRRFRRDWLVAFLLKPHDLRPGLEATMPRLAISHEDAELMATVLAPQTGPSHIPPGGSVKRGRALFSARGCDGCHTFSDRHKAPPPQPTIDRNSPANVRLAPDLRHVRDRFRRDNLQAWIQDPQSLDPAALMPNLNLSKAEADDLAAYLMLSPLHEQPQSGSLKIAPLSAKELSEPVGFEEINARVLRGSCWHCHSDPDFNAGDGGPGNSGGFGFAGIGLDLSGYPGIAEGAFESGWSASRLKAHGGRADDPRPYSDVLTPASASRLTRALRARQLEERGKVVPGVRGMPLGLPSLSEADIRLVERWVAQGALL